jgi:hypothetical protein
VRSNSCLCKPISCLSLRHRRHPESRQDVQRKPRQLCIGTYSGEHGFRESFSPESRSVTPSAVEGRHILRASIRFSMSPSPMNTEAGTNNLPLATHENTNWCACSTSVTAAVLEASSASLHQRRLDFGTVLICRRNH